MSDRLESHALVDVALNRKLLNASAICHSLGTGRSGCLVEPPSS